MNSHYTIIIQWSDEDECFVVSLPEWGEFCHTHGETYEDALKNAQEVLEMLIESSLADGETLPEPKTLGKSLEVAL
jgi:antitoxin HicB